jgi:hypothetical protein
LTCYKALEIERSALPIWRLVTRSTLLPWFGKLIAVIPQYLFAKVNYANLCLQHGEIENVPRIFHTPSDLVVNEWGANVGNSSALDFLLLHNLEVRFVT